jgi:APA family basic amino acid/polyamine antiporter
MSTTQVAAGTIPLARGALLRILGLGFGLAVVVGGTIGVGILRTPGPVAALVTTPTLFLTVWVLGGIYALLGANYVSELATMLPHAGGPFVYARRAYGGYGGFALGWSDWINNTAALAFLGIASAEYLVRLVPALGGAEKPVAMATLAGFAALNWVGLRAGSRVQQLTSALKALALLLFVAVCLVAGGSGGVQTTAASQPLPSGFALVVALVLAFQLVLGTYGGWNAAVYFAEEDQDSARNLPRSLLGGVGLIMGIYVLVNIGLLSVLSLPEIAGSTLPVADAVQRALGGMSGPLVTGFALLSLLGIINAVFMLTPRTLFALGREGLFSGTATAVNPGGTPVVALLITAVVAMLLTLSGTFETLLAVYAIIGVAMNIAQVGALFILRRREPELPRPYRTWGYPVAPLLLVCVDVALCVGFAVSDSRNALFAAIMLAASYPIYLVVKRRGALAAAA